MTARSNALSQLCVDYARIAIVSGPRSGKSSLTQGIDDRPVIAADRFAYLPWASTPTVIIQRCEKLGRFIVEGTHVARALRAGLVVDAVMYLDESIEDPSPNQRAIAVNMATIFREWRATNPTVHVVSPDTDS